MKLLIVHSYYTRQKKLTKIIFNNCKKMCKLSLNHFCFCFLGFFFLLTDKQALAQEYHCVTTKDVNQNCSLAVELFNETEWENSHVLCDSFFATSGLLRIRGEEISIGSVNPEICKPKANTFEIYGWTPLKEFEQYFEKNDTFKNYSYIAKIGHSDEKITSIADELCVLDLENGNCKLLSNNVVPLYKAYFNVLVKLLPIRYELHNINYEKIENVTLLNKTPIATTSVKNLHKKQEQIHVIVHYRYVERIIIDQKNIEDILSVQMAKIGILIQYQSRMLELDGTGIGNLLQTSKYVFSVTLPLKSEIFVQLIGQWQRHEQRISGNLITFYGNGLFRTNQIETKISVTKIVNPEPVYNEPTSLIEYTEQQLKGRSVKSGNNYPEEKIVKSNIYPGFRPYFVIGCLIVLTTAILVFGNMFRLIIIESRRKGKPQESLLPKK